MPAREVAKALYVLGNFPEKPIVLPKLPILSNRNNGTYYWLLHLRNIPPASLMNAVRSDLTASSYR